MTGPGGRGGPVTVSLDATAVPPDPGGAGRYTEELVRALGARTDVELVVWARVGDGRRWHALAPRSDVAAVAPRNRPARLIWEQARLPGLIAGGPATVHHGPHYTMPRRVRIPRVVTIHDLTFVDRPEWHQPAKAAFFRRAIRAAAVGADALVAVSQTTAERLRALFEPRAPVFVIPHGVDHGRLRPSPAGSDPSAEDAESLARLGVKEPYVAFVGTLEPRKDVPGLIRAFDRVAPAHPALSLVLAGASGWGRASIDAALAVSPHRDRIRLCGWVGETDKPALLRRAAVVAYPSLEEGFGLPALEALACGVPLVTTRGTSMEEVVGRAALLVEPGDVDSLSEALSAALAGGPDTERRRRDGLAVAARYTWAASAEAHLSVYRSVC